MNQSIDCRALMKALPLALLLALAPAAALAAQAAGDAKPAAGKSATAKKGPTLEEYQNVVQRNIFSRTGGPPPEPPKQEDHAPTPQIDHIDLIGASVDSGTGRAYFSGQRGVQEVMTGQKIGEFVVSKIVPEGVRLECEGQTIDLPVLYGLSKTGDSAWSVGPVLQLADATPTAAPITAQQAYVADRQRNAQAMGGMQGMAGILGGRNTRGRGRTRGGGGPGGGGGGGLAGLLGARFGGGGGGGGSFSGPGFAGSFTPDNSGAAATPAATPASGTPASSPDLEAVRKRMEERRRQETGQ